MPKHFYTRILALLLIVGIGHGNACAMTPASPPTEVFTVRAVAIQVTDPNPAEAKAKAMGQARNEAARQLLIRLTPKAYYPKWQQTGEWPLTRWIQSIAIRNERVDENTYQAEYDVAFRPQPVLDYLADESIPALTQSAPEFLLLPIYDRGDQWILGGEQNLWHQAWQNMLRQKRFGLLPFKIPAQIEQLDTADLTPSVHTDTLRALAAQHGVIKVLLVVARLEATTNLDGTTSNIEVQTIGLGAGPEPVIGNHSFRGEVNQPIQDLLAQAAAGVLQQLEDEWKSEIQNHSANRTLEVMVPLRSLADWVEIHQRLKSVPIVQEVRLRAMTRQSAQLVLKLSGTAEAMSGEFQQYNLLLTPNEPVAVLQLYR